MKEAKDILLEALSGRTAINPSYSLRAFARDLEISPQQLSNVMNGRRGLGSSMAEKVVVKMGLDEDQKEIFLESLKARFSKSQIQRKIAKTKMRSKEASHAVKEIEKDLFKIISQWYHLALIELIKITPVKNHTPRMFSQRLGIPEKEITFSLERLERLNLITGASKGWKANQDVVIADYEVSPESISSFHRQVLEKAMVALSFQTSKERYGSSSTIPVKVKDLSVAKDLIQKFRLEFDNAISDPGQGDEVYGLSIQFFKLTNTVEKKS